MNKLFTKIFKNYNKKVKFQIEIVLTESLLRTKVE